MAMTSEEQEREAQLYARVTASREVYNQAKLEAAALEKMAAELGVNHPDRRESMLHAARIERNALKAYGEATRAFKKFSLRKTPRQLEAEIAPIEMAFAGGSSAPNGSVPPCPEERPIPPPNRWKSKTERLLADSQRLTAENRKIILELRRLLEEAHGLCNSVARLRLDALKPRGDLAEGLGMISAALKGQGYLDSMAPWNGDVDVPGGPAGTRTKEVSRGR